MDEQQLLNAIRGIVQEETGKLSDRMDGLEGKIAGIEDRISKIDNRMTNIEDKMTDLKISYENKTDRILKLLEEDYSRVDAAVKKVRDYDDVKSTVADHDHAIKNHNERLTELEKKVI